MYMASMRVISPEIFKKPQVRAAGKPAWDARAMERVRAGLAVAAAAAADHAAGPGARANAGTGEVLRANFLLLCDAVATADGHLLAEQERAFIAAFKARRHFATLSMRACLLG